MKNIFSIGLLLASSILFAQEDIQTATSTNNSWKLSMGINYRSFGKIDFKEVSPNGGQFINGSVTDIGAGLYLYKVTDPNSQILVDNVLNDTITYTTATANSDDFGIDGGMAGIVLKASKVFKQGDTFNWSFDFTLATAYTQSSSGAGATLVDTGFDFGPDWNSSLDGNGVAFPGPYPPAAPVEGKTEGVSPNYDPFSPGGSISTMNINYDLNLGVYTFGAGISTACHLGPVNIFVAGGPTLSVVDYDIDYSATSADYHESKSAESTDLRAGLYGELGVELMLGESWGVGISSRYDWIPIEVNTDLASLDLSGLSCNVFISYQF